MATDIAELGIKIEANDIRAAVRELDRLDKKSEKAERSTGKLSKAMSGLRGKMAALVTVAGAVGYARLTKDAIEYADAIAKTSDKLGVSTDALQEYRYAAERSGVAQNALDMGLQRFSRRLGEADKGMGELKGSLDELGISTRDSQGNIRTAEDVLKDYANAIQAAEGDQEKLRLAFKAFDSEGAAMVNMLRDGASGLQELRDQAQDAGVIMDEQLIRKAEIINDKWDTLVQTIGVKLKNALISVADVFVDTATSAEKIAEIDQKIIDLSKSMTQVGVSYTGVLDQIKLLNAEKQKLLDLSKKEAEENEKPAQTEAQMTANAELLAMSKAFYEKDKEQRLQSAREAAEEEANLRRFAQARMIQNEETAQRTATEASKMAIEERIGYVHQTLGNLSSLMSSENKKLFEIGKAAALGSAIINTSLAITKTMTTVPYPWNIPLAAAQGLAGAVQVQNIRAQQFQGQAHSGLDNVPSEGTYLLQKGEMVLDPGTSEQVRNAASGMGGGNINVTIQAMDGADVERVLSNNRALLYNINRQGMYENGENYA